MQGMPQRSEGLILLLNIQGSQEKGLHPAPLGAAQHPPRRSQEPFPTKPSLACSTPAPLALLPRLEGPELSGAPHARGLGGGGDTPEGASLRCGEPLAPVPALCADHASAGTFPQPAWATARLAPSPDRAPLHGTRACTAPLPAERRAPGSWDRTNLALPAPPCLPCLPRWAPAPSTAGQYQPPAKEVPKITRWPQLLLFL